MGEIWNYAEMLIGTRAFHIGGGYWERVKLGWQWCTGSTFPTPGANVVRVELPDQDHDKQT